MKKVTITIAAAFTALFAMNVQAQDNNDQNTASHGLSVSVPEVALIDIYDANPAVSAEAGTISFDMADATQNGVNAEAGMYDFAALIYENLYLNYTSVVAGAANAFGYDLERDINVQMQTGSTFPGSLDLVITPEAPVVITDGGTVNSAGTAVTAGVRLGQSTAIGTDALLVDSIESVYTGDASQGNYGVKLTYTIEQNGNFSAYQAGDYNATLVYTITDL